MRFWEIDALRGIAILLMILFNWAFALQYLQITSLDLGWIFWSLFPRAIASMFIIIAGISFVISYSRAAAEKQKKSGVYKKYLTRGLKIFLLGLLATAATWIFFPQNTILFGILHFIGVALMAAPLLIKLRRWTLPSAIIFIAIGVFLQNFTVSYPWLLWLGFQPANFYTFDYFPLLPWLGVFMIGIFLGDRLYKKGRRTFKTRNETITAKILSFLGRHSLLIYVLHQPVLLAILYALGYAVL